MSFKNFSLVKEDANHFHIAHKNGKKLSVPKAGLTAPAMKMVQSLPRNFADGGEATSQDSGTYMPADQVPEVVGPQAAPAPPAAAPAPELSQDQKDLAYYSANASESPYYAQRAQELQAKLGGQTAPASSGSPTDSAAPDADASRAPGSTGTPNPVPSPSAPSGSPSDPMQLKAAAGSAAYSAQKNANLAEANAIQGEGKAESQAINDTQAKIDALPTQKDLLDKYKAQNDALLQAYQSKQIDPERYYKNQSTGSKILSGILMALGGGGAAVAGQQNLAYKVVQDNIERDIDAQKNDQSKAMNLWKMNREAMGDDMSATLATQNQMYTGLKFKLEQAAAQFKGPQAMARAQAANAQIDQTIAQNNIKLSLMNPTQGSADPATRVQFLVPPERQQKVFDEIEAAQNTTRNAPGILESFDKAAKNIHAVDFVPGMQNADQKSMHALMGPTFKDVEGTVRQAAMDNMFQNTTPQFGDDKNTIATKRAALVGYLESKSSAPTAKGFGIDLSKFPSTSGVAPQQVERVTADGKVAIFDSSTKKFLGYKN